MLQMQLQAGELMASAGDYSILARLYGLTPEQIALLQEKYGGGSGGGTRYYNPNPGPEDNDTSDMDTIIPEYLRVIGPDYYDEIWRAAKNAATVNQNPGPMIPNAPIQPSRYDDSKSGLK